MNNYIINSDVDEQENFISEMDLEEQDEKIYDDLLQMAKEELDNLKSVLENENEYGILDNADEYDMLNLMFNQQGSLMTYIRKNIEEEQKYQPEKKYFKDLNSLPVKHRPIKYYPVEEIETRINPSSKRTLKDRKRRRQLKKKLLNKRKN